MISIKEIEEIENKFDEYIDKLVKIMSTDKKQHAIADMYIEYLRLSYSYKEISYENRSTIFSSNLWASSIISKSPFSMQLRSSKKLL